MICIGEHEAILCKGDFEPAALYKGSTFIGGAVSTNFEGSTISADRTYNAPIEVEQTGKTEQVVTVLSVTDQLGKHLFPFIIGSDGLFDMQVSGTNLSYFWIANGSQVTTSSVQFSGLAENTVVWLVVNNEILPANFTINNNYVSERIKLDLADLQGKITYYLCLYGCNQITGSLADLQGKITYRLHLGSCNQITGSLADLQGKITYYLDLYSCNQITGSLADLQGKITYYLRLYGCNQITGSLADLQGKITYYLHLGSCNQITGVYSPLSTTQTPSYIYLNDTGQTTADVDNTLIACATNSQKHDVTFMSNARTSASDSAVATLKALGWQISCGGVVQ